MKRLVKFESTPGFLIAFLVLAFFSQSVEGREFPEASGSIDVGFAFHKLSNTQPDFDDWTTIFIRPHQDDYGPRGRRRYYRETKEKLKKTFARYNTDQESLTVNMPAKVEVISLQRGDNADEDYMVNVFFKKGVPFITKKIPGYNINIIVEDIETALKPIINQHQYIKADRLPYFRLGEQTDVYLSMTLTPVRADASRPLTLNGERYWLMLTELENFEIWDPKRRRMLWDYSDYKSGESPLDQLRSLYK